MNEQSVENVESLAKQIMIRFFGSNPAELPNIPPEPCLTEVLEEKSLCRLLLKAILEGGFSLLENTPTNENLLTNRLFLESFSNELQGVESPETVIKKIAENPGSEKLSQLLLQLSDATNAEETIREILYYLIEKNDDFSSSDPPLEGICAGVDPSRLTPYFTERLFHMHTLSESTPWIAANIADYDNDGDPDLPDFENLGNFSFQKRDVIQYQNAAYHGVAAIDYDRDSYKDVIMAPYNSPGVPIQMFRNLGNWQFKPVFEDYFSNLLGMNEESKWYSETIIIADLTGDGLNDIYIPFYTPLQEPHQSIFLRNASDRFVEEALLRGIGNVDTPIKHNPEGAQAIDIDNDGDLDMYAYPRLFINDGNGYFTDATSEYGLSPYPDEGIAFIDYNNDGLLDLFTRSIDSEHQLYRNTGNGFEDVTQSSGLACLVKDIEFSWGDVWADFDSDGDMDLLYKNFGHQTGAPKSYLYLNQGDSNFRLGKIFEGTFGEAVADFNLDGYLDLYGCCPQQQIGENIFVSFGRVSLAIVPLDLENRRTEQGTTIRVLNQCSTPQVIQTRVIGTSNVFLAQGEYPAYFSVQKDCAYEIEITFIKKGSLEKKMVKINFEPAVEGALRIFVNRETFLKKAYSFQGYPDLTKNRQFFPVVQ